MKQPGITPWQDLRLVAAGAALGVLAVIAMLAFRTPPERARLTLDGTATGWTEIAWPFLPDPWWPSKAFTCDPATCANNSPNERTAGVGL